MTLFNSLLKAGQDTKAHHSAWLDLIREKIWIRIKYEEEMIPSLDALDRHWKRSCWVHCIWNQAISNNIIYPSLLNYGWKQPDSSTLSIDWDSDTNVTQIRERVSLIRKGCGCKTGCQTSRCKCKKGSHYCGLGCKCQGCMNLPLTSQSRNVVDLDVQTSSSESEIDFEDEVDNIMEDVFGDFLLDRDYDSDLQESVEDNDEMEVDIGHVDTVLPL